MKIDRKTLVFLCALLAAIALTALAATAGSGAGSQTDPLVTLSYLTDTFTGQIMDKVDSLLAQREGGDGYSVVNLAPGQALHGEAGCEVLLRSGAARCAGTGGAILADATSGGELDSGSALAANHLYLMPAGCGVTAPEGAVLLVRGTYTVQ